jgi:hypothetical protein
MLKIQHRVNTIAELKATPKHVGVELDLRSKGDDIIIHHDPFCDGEKLDEYLTHFNHSFIILNTKEEGLELRLLELMKRHNIENFFFLDLSMPFLIKTMNQGISNIAVRFSHYEPIEFVRKFKGKVDWVWIDYFDSLPLNQDNYDELKAHFKLCLVSPELLGHDLSRLEKVKATLRNMPLDAVCTKRPDMWA